MEKWVHKYNMTFKSMTQQNRDKGYSFFKTVEQYNKLIAQKIAVEIRCKELENIIKRITTESIPA